MFLELTKHNDQRIAIRACEVISVEEDTRTTWSDELQADVVIPSTVITYSNGRTQLSEYVKEDYENVMSKLR